MWRYTVLQYDKTSEPRWVAVIWMFNPLTQLLCFEKLLVHCLIESDLFSQYHLFSCWCMIAAVNETGLSAWGPTLSQTAQLVGWIQLTPSFIMNLQGAARSLSLPMPAFLSPPISFSLSLSLSLPQFMLKWWLLRHNDDDKSSAFSQGKTVYQPVCAGMIVAVTEGWHPLLMLWRQWFPKMDGNHHITAAYLVDSRLLEVFRPWRHIQKHTWRCRPKTSQRNGFMKRAVDLVDFGVAGVLNVWISHNSYCYCLSKATMQY